MMKAKEDSVNGLTKGVEFLFKKNKVDYIKGTGSFVDEHTVRVNLIDGGEADIKAKNIVIATGSESTPFPGLEIDEKKVVTSTGAIALEEVPKRLTVIGGGIIGLEMVSAALSFSTERSNPVLGICMGSSRRPSYRRRIPRPDRRPWYGCRCRQASPKDSR